MGTFVAIGIFYIVDQLLEKLSNKRFCSFRFHTLLLLEDQKICKPNTLTLGVQALNFFCIFLSLNFDLFLQKIS